MARLLRPSFFKVRVAAFACLIMQTALLFGQATTPQAMQSPSVQPNLTESFYHQIDRLVGPVNMATSPAVNNTQFTPSGGYYPANVVSSFGGNSNPAANLYGTPNNYSRPTTDQTLSYINSHPVYQYLDDFTKFNMAYGGYLPKNIPYINGQQNPLYQSAGQQLTPNWYLPSTWPSSNMNWTGVRSDGTLPSGSLYSSYSTYNPTNTYNPSYNNSYNYNQQIYRPNQQQQPQVPNPYTSRTTDPQFRALNSAVANPSRINPGSVVDLKNAITGRERALAVSQVAGDKVAQISSHAELARLFLQSGNTDQALVHIKAAEPLANQLADTQQRAELQRVKGSAYMVSGDFEHAIAAYKESAAAMRSQKSDLNPAGLFNKTSWYSASIGADTKSVAYSLSVFSEPVTDPNSRNRKNAEAETLTSVGWAYQSMGNVADALANYKTAKTLFIESGNKDGRVRTQLAIASVYQSIGEREKAIEEYKQLPRTIPTSQWIRVLVSVAEILQSLNRPSEALVRYEKAFKLAQPLGDSMQTAIIFVGMGRCYMLLRNYAEAELNFKLALVDMRKSGNRAGEAGVIANLGELQYWQAINLPRNDAKQHFTGALEYYSQALPLMREAGDRNGEIGVLANTALIYDAWGKPNEALNYYLQALQKLEELQIAARLEEFRMDVSDQSTGLYQRAIMLELDQHNVREAFELSERSRARSFLDQISAVHNQSTGRLPAAFSAREEELRKEDTLLERQIGQELSKSGPEINAERLQALKARLTVVRKEYEDAVRDLKISNPNLASLLSISPLPLSELQKQLRPDVTVVSYFTAMDQPLAFVITRTTFDAVKLRVSAWQLATAIATFRDFSGENSGSATLKDLHKWLIGPLKSHLNTSTLAIVPYGPINDLPFAALTADGQHFLSDKYAVFYLPSVNVLPYLQPKDGAGANSMFVLANEGVSGSPRLPYANDEARAVASIYGVQPILGEAATASLIRSHAGDYQIVHLAAHVATDRQHPQFSTIATSEGKKDDGELGLNQVVDLDLRKTNLVVVSGCESQLGRHTRGDDVVSLSRAFMFAGSPSVIASLWNVDDEATQQLMVAFYTHLKAGLGKAEALRAAEMDVRAQHPNPYYWAGFVLMGDPGNVGTFNLVATASK